MRGAGSEESFRLNKQLKDTTSLVDEDMKKFISDVKDYSDVINYDFLEET